MAPTTLDDRPLVPTIAAAREAVEHYWDAYAPELDAGAALDDALDPLDGFLVHLVLALLPPGAVVVDLAAGATAGASTVVGLAHPSVRKVLAGLAAGTGPVRVAAALRGYADDKAVQGKLEILPSVDPPADLVARQGLVILADARAVPAGELAAAVARWVDSRPDAVVLVLGVGPVGGGGAAEALVRAAGAGADRTVWLVREAAEALAASRLAVVARSGHPLAADTVRRVGRLYTGNVRYLDLLWQSNAAAIGAAGADAAAMQAHPSASPVLAEIEKLKWELTAARNEINWMRDRQAWADAHAAKADEAWAAMHQQSAALDRQTAALSEIQRSLAYRAANRVRLVRVWVAPENTLRHGAYRRARRAGQVLRAEGPWGLFLRGLGVRR